MADYLSLLTGLESRLETNRCALAASGMAILDALARTLKLPFWRLYGGKPSKIRTDITVVIGTVAQAHDCNDDALNRLHGILSPAERAARCGAARWCRHHSERCAH